MGEMNNLDKWYMVLKIKGWYEQIMNKAETSILLVLWKCFEQYNFNISQVVIMVIVIGVFVQLAHQSLKDEHNLM